MTQPAVSRSIAALEVVVGGPLITRSPEVAPTALGRAILQHVDVVQGGVRAIEAEVAMHHQQGANGMVRLGAGTTASHRLVPALLVLWRQATPMLDVRLLEGSDDEVDDWLEAGTVDAAIVVNAEYQAPGLVELVRDDFRAVLRHDHPLAGEARISIADLADDPFLASTSGCESPLAALHEQAGLRFRPAQHVHETSTLIGMVDADLGVSALPALARTMLPPGVVMVPLQERVPWTLAFTGPVDRPWHPGVHRMATSLAEAWPQLEVTILAGRPDGPTA